MIIPIPIPIGVKNVAFAQGRVMKVVHCAHCQQDYAYWVELEAPGVDHDVLFLDGEGSAKRAQAQAEQNLLLKSLNIVVPVPCPNCGTYQDDMAQRLKEDASINSLQIAGVVIALLSVVPLAFDLTHIWLLTFLMAVVGLALLARGYAVAFQFDPNAGDPAPRKALGCRHAVWGEQLAALLAMRPPANPDLQ